MGNTPTTKKIVLESDLAKQLDKIAAEFITKSKLPNFIDPKVCKKYIILTSKVFDDKLDHQQIKYMAQRTRRGIIVDEYANDKVYYGTDLTKLDIKNKVKKKRLCIGIAKFYIKIGHIFGAILKTLNPEYVIQGQTGPRNISIVDVGKIPINPNLVSREPTAAPTLVPVSTQPTKRARGNNFCNKRINALTPVIDSYHEMTPMYKINICSINGRPLPRGQYGPEEKVIGFMDLIGMKSLDNLYKIEDSGYDYRIGKFTKMSESAKKDYKNAVNTFYKIFTGKKSVPPNITSFADIPLTDYKNKPACDRRINGTAVTNFRYDPKVSPYKEYASHLSEMMSNFTEGQKKLADIIKEIFAKQINKDTKHIEYTINPKLTNQKLDAITLKTRKIIVELYSQCESDFRTGIKLFETIIEKKEQDYNTGIRNQLKQEIGTIL